MARKRMIDPAIWTDQKIIKLTNNEMLLFIGIFSHADDEGIIEKNYQSLYFKLGRSEWTITEIETYYKKLEEAKLIVSYGDYSFLPNWYKYQKLNRPIKTNLKRPPKIILNIYPDYISKWGSTFKQLGENSKYPYDSCYEDSLSNHNICNEDSLSNHEQLTPSIDQYSIDKININVVPEYKNNQNLPDIKNPLPVTVDKKYNNEFENWYKNYPRKSGKFKAFQYFKKILKEGLATIDQLNLAVKNYKTYILEKAITDEQYIKMADTFLSPISRKWEDYLNFKSRDSPIIDRSYFAAMGLQGSDAPQEETIRSDENYEEIDRLFQEKLDPRLKGTNR